MRILMPTTEFPPTPGGVSAVAWEQANGLAKLGHEVVVETLDFSQYGTPPAPEADIKVHYRPTRAKAIKRVLPLTAHNLKTAKTFRPNIVLCPQYRGTGVPAMLAAKQAKCPLVFYLHSTEIQTELKNKLRKFIVTKTLLQASALIANSRNTKNLLHTWLPGLSQDISIVYPGFNQGGNDCKIKQCQNNKNLFLEKYKVLQKNPIILASLSRITLQKGIDKTIEAIAKLIDNNPQLEIVYLVGGTGPDREIIENLVRQYHLENTVLFLGRLAEEEKVDFFNALDIFLQPSQPYQSFIEGFGISLVEAQSYGKPVISVDWGGIPEAVAKDKSGILMPVGDQQALEEAILKLATDKDLRIQMGRAGIEHVKQFSWEKHSKQVESILLSFMPNNK